MADGGNGLPLTGGYRGEQRPGGSEEDTVPCPGAQVVENIAVEHRSGAAAAGAAGVHILCLSVINQHAAVQIGFLQIDARVGIRGNSACERR